MNAIIMAGGEGTRLKSVTGDLPKPMVLLAGKPVLEHILALLRRCGVENVCMSLHYRPEVIREYFGDGSRFGMNIEYHVEERQLGTAGGIKACADFYGDRDFMVISGDSVCDFDLRQLMEAHHRHHPAVTMALYSNPSPLQYGTVLTDSRGRVVSFTEKPEWARVVSDLVNTGIYIVSPQAMELVPEATAFDFSRDLFPRLMECGMEIRALPMDGYWCDIGTPRAYHQCSLDAIDGHIDVELPAESAQRVKSPARPHFSGARRELGCAARARAMRYISQSLMEAGADFSDGLSLHTATGEVHICPSTERESIIISAEAGSPEKSMELAEKYEHLVTSFFL